MRLPAPLDGFYPVSLRLKKRTIMRLLKIAKTWDDTRTGVVRQLIDDKYKQMFPQTRRK